MSFQIIRDDITRVKVDAIVDPTNQYYYASGGADYAIHQAAGPLLDEACAKLPLCEVGEVQITPGFDLPAKYVIHTVGPVWNGGNNGEQAQLRSCYRKSMELAKSEGLESIAFPLIASGTFKYPKAEAIEAAMSEIREFVSNNEMIVYLVVFDKEALRVTNDRYGEIRSFISESLVSDVGRRGLFHRSDLSGPLISERVHRLRDSRPSEAISYDSCESSPTICENAAPCAPEKPKRKASGSLLEMLRQKDESFTEKLLHMIDARGMKDVECYKKANVDKQLFNKIKNKKGYHPQKSTVIALAFALEPTWEELIDLVESAGFSLTMNNQFDIIVTYCFEHGIMNVFDVNELLFQFDQPLLGSFAK